MVTGSFYSEARPFYPHVTVARKLKALPDLGPIEPIRWEVERFCLVASLATPVGVQYKVVRCYRAGTA
ncbi:2'-5' RNA ligase family protein [Halorhodospira abdelmalekii]|uniref:2'-5' RNA ligase family protein n=1 Tax=Halorhodospira abdelmalekii TaxID=421629 RepID=UPI0019075C08|nr:hypothetical protein [Halorhodospira abdelmalekii]